MQRSIQRTLGMIVVICTLVAATGMTGPGQAVAFGTFETSAFRIRWSDRWQEVRRTDANVVLHDGLTEIQMVGIQDDVTPQESVAEIVTDWFTAVLPAAEQVTEVPGSATADETRASTIRTYQHPTSSGSLVPYAAYLEARSISPTLLLWIVVDTEWGAFNADPHFFERALQTLEIVGTPTTGEVSQTFASGGWRVSVPTAAVADRFPALGLAPQSGMQWLVVLADVVNWTAAAAEFDTATAQVVAGDGQRFGPSALHGQSAALSLRVPSPAGALVPVDAGALVRVPLVFQISAGAQELVLEIGDQQMPLNDMQVSGIEASALPPEQRPPDVQEATIAGLDGTSLLQLQLPSGNAISVPLTGIVLPDLEGCHGREAWTEVMSLIGQRVLIEADAGILGNAHRWVWLDGPDGRVLLNQRLVERGSATVFAVPETSRFATWLNETEETARSSEAGLWQQCRSQVAAATSGEVAGEVTFEIEPGADPGDVAFIREGIAFAARLFSEYSGEPVGRPLTVNIHAGSSASMETQGLYQSDTVEIFTGSAAWTLSPDIRRLYTVVHEYAHFYLDPAPHDRRRSIWLEEGLAEMLSWQLLDRAGLVTNSEMMAWQALRMRIWPPGSDLCAISQQSISSIAYPLANLGAALLVERAPFGSVKAYRDTMAAGMPETEAFPAAFGIDEATFCAGAMDSIWSIPAAPAQPRPLYARSTEVVPSEVAIFQLHSAGPGSQVLFTARTTDSAVCDWQLGGQVPLSRTVLADGDGDIFWLVTIPPEAAMGAVTVSVNCGGASDEVVVGA